MKLKRPFLRFKLFDRKQDAYLILPQESVWSIISYPNFGGEGATVVLHTEKGDFEVEGEELETLSILGWLDT